MGGGSLLIVEYWSAIRQAFSTWRVHPDVSLLPMTELYIWVLSQLPKALVVFPMEKRDQKLQTKICLRKVTSRASAPIPSSGPLLNITLLWPLSGCRKSLTYLSMISFLPVCACFNWGLTNYSCMYLWDKCDIIIYE